MSSKQQPIIILDFGSQYTQLIARRIRQLHVYCEIHAGNLSAAQLQAKNPQAIILSGGPASVNDDNAPDIDPAILQLPLPILGICYGQQLLAVRLGGKVIRSTHREYGRAKVYCHTNLPGVAEPLLRGFNQQEPFEAWMSHGDKISELPGDFVAVAHTDSTPHAIVVHQYKPIVGLQFHPEVSHSPRGMELIKAFVFDIAHAKPTWTMESFLQQQIKTIQAQVQAHEQVICALSGGVDSAVVAALLAKTLGKRLHCIFVDNGLLRHNEVHNVHQVFTQTLGISLHIADASTQFLQALEGVVDPEAKRKKIGAAFVEVFEACAKNIANAKYLAQGTLYPDVIESVSAKGPSATIKSHHNVGGLPERMQLKLIEPLRELFKDEVRLLGQELGLPKAWCMRQPFPGPGMAVRIVGEITPDRLRKVRQADAIVEAEIAAANYTERCWQCFAVLLPVRSVGVMGDARTYDETMAVRCVDSLDGMTADWSRLPYDILSRISNRIINEVEGINRVVYDISSKPPATIEWE